MKILLIIPPLLKEDRYGRELEKAGPTSEPLGLAYLAGSIEKAGFEVKILDTLALNWDKDKVAKYINKHYFDIIGVQLLTPMYIRAQEIIRLIKKNSPSTKIISGAAHMTIMPEKAMEENPEIDVGVIGDGEDTIVELLKEFEKKKPDLSAVKGIIYRQSDCSIVRTSQRLMRENLDEYPMPTRHLLPMDKYTPTVTYYKRLPSYIMITSRGCPYRCTYCCRIAGRRYRTHTIKRVLEEMDELINKYKAKEIIFRDDTFTLNKEFVITLCKEIMRRNYHKKIEWTCMTRVNLVNYELLKLMKKAGCWSIHYGVESGNQRLLDLIKKDITLDDVRKAFYWTRKAGIETKAFFMLGLPTETKKETLKTIRFAKEIDPDWAQFTITTPYPGTELYEIAKKNGFMKSFKWEHYQSWAGFTDNELVYVPEGWTSAKLKAMQPYALRQFYLRPKIILRILWNMRSLSVFIRSLWGAWAILKTSKPAFD